MIRASPLDLRLSIFAVEVVVAVQSSERTTSIEHREYLCGPRILHVTIQP